MTDPQMGLPRDASESPRIGTYDWVAEQKVMSGADSRRLLGALVGMGVRNLVGLLRMRFGFVPGRVTQIDSGLFDPPDSSLAKQAQEAWMEQKSPAMREHSCRTWMYGRALAALDQCDLDCEAFYCAALLHDYGLDRQPIDQSPSTSGPLADDPANNIDFTLKGANRAQLAIFNAYPFDAAGGALARAVAEAICIHATPGISISQDGALGYYVQAGSMADATGLRRWSVGRAAMAEIYKRQMCTPDFKAVLKDQVWKEAKAVPKGRFALCARWRLTWLIQLAP